jgi:hypothetical protein
LRSALSKLRKELRKEGCRAEDHKVSDEGILVAKWFNNKQVMMGFKYYSVKLASHEAR